jgi:hypothetical protein
MIRQGGLVRETVGVRAASRAKHSGERSEGEETGCRTSHGMWSTITIVPLIESAFAG